MTLEEKRVYAERAGRTDAYVATELGVAVVSISGDRVGEFGLERRCTARDVAADGRPAVATDEDVLLGTSLEQTGFGPAVAVGFDGDPVAAGPDGRIARREDGTWTTLGTVEDVRAIDGDLLAAAGGVYRLGDLSPVGLADARDVATGGTPLAATGEGLYYLGPGWVRALEGAFEAVARDGRRVHAATADACYERAGGDDEWVERAVPVEGPIVDVAHGEGTYAVTRGGTVLADAGDGWRHRSIGLGGVVGVAVP